MTHRMTEPDRPTGCAGQLERRHAIWRLAAAAVAFAVTLAIGRYAYRDVVLTTDENSYLFQATTFSRLSLRCPPPPHPLEQLLIRGMNVLDPERGWFSRYPPGHALWLVPGILAGDARIMSALAAALSLWLLTGAARSLRAPWWAAAVFLLLSPYFLFMHGTLLSHTSGMLAVSLMLWAYLRWRETRRICHVVLAGGAWAFLFLGRPYTAALLVPAFALDGLVLWFRRRDRATFLALCAFAAAALSGPLLMLVYNKLVTGNAGLCPYAMYAKDPHLGFHERHTFALGLTHLGENLRLLDTWLLGVPGALGGLAAAFFLCRSSAPVRLAAVAVVSLVAGYVLFYYPGFNTSGPYYYFEALPFMAVTVALLAQHAARWRRARAAGLVLFAAIAVFSVRFTWREACAFRARNAHEAAMKEFIRGAPPGAVIFTVDENVHQRDDLEARLRPNLLGMASDPLMLRSVDEGCALVAPLFPGRPMLRLRNLTPPRLEPVPAPASPYAVRIRGSITASDTGRGNGSREESAWCRTATPEDPAGYLAFGRYQIAPVGRLKAIFDLTVSNVPPDRPVVLFVMGGIGPQELARREISGSPGRIRLEVPFHLASPASVEPSVFYSGGGTVSFWSMSVESADSEPRPDEPARP
jgi:hypothetical protein